jgi:nicotinate phosphoribosyltransferase
MRNLSLLTDLYELTMIYGYYKSGMADREAVFDLFFRGTEELSYAVVAGLEQAIEYVENIHFDEEDIAYLRGLNLFDEDFLAKLASFRFSGDIQAMPEGSIVYPY